MIRTTLCFPAAVLALAAVLATSVPARAAEMQDRPEKKVLHNASVQEIIKQLSGEKKGPRYRGLTIGAPVKEASRKPDSGCYAVGSTVKTRGLTVTAEPPKPHSGGKGQEVASAAPQPAASGTGCHPGYISLIRFAYDSARLEPTARSELDKIATALRSPALEGDRFVIAGHTDGAGSDAYNLTLSARRAVSVVHYLSERGVNADRMLPEGRGERELLDKADPLSAVNRRVEIINASE